MRCLEVVLPLKTQVFTLISPESFAVAHDERGEWLLSLHDKVYHLSIVRDHENLLEKQKAFEAYLF